MIGAYQISVDHVLRAAAIPGLRGSFGGTLDNQVGLMRQRGQILGRADIAVNELNTGFAKPSQIQFGAAPAQVIERDNSGLQENAFQSDGQRGTGESSAAGHQNAFRRHYSGERARRKRDRGKRDDSRRETGSSRATSRG